MNNILHRHNRRSIRLKGFDYSQQGLYFITICCKDKKHLFGKIVNNEMQLSPVGKVAEQCWRDIPLHFENVALHPFVIMPNHIHSIIEIVGAKYFSVGAKYFSPKDPQNSLFNGTSQTIGSIIRGFKIGVTKWVRANTDIYYVWQRNYYEHIIRNEESYDKICEYIEHNPINWQNDQLYSP